MRIRTKKWARPELSVCDFFIKDPENHKGKWKELFQNDNPLYIELGCGKSPFLAEIGLLHPEINFIGIDISMDILGVARRNIQTAYDEKGKKVDNVLLTAFNIEYIDKYFSKEDGCDRLYISFCNPWPREKHKKRRLTHTRQLIKYRDFLNDGACVWFKTDNQELYEDSFTYFKEADYKILKQTEDLHNAPDIEENIMTEHEKMFSDMGIAIKGIIAKK